MRQLKEKKPRKKISLSKASDLKAEWKCSYISMTRDMFGKMKWSEGRANELQSNSRIRCVKEEGDNICVCTISSDPGAGSVLTLYKIIRQGKRSEVVTYSREEKRYMYFTDHFFQRYRERLNLTDYSITDLVRHYADNNKAVKYEQVRNENQADSIRAASNKGLLCCDKRTSDLTTFKTIITKDLFNRKQARAFKTIRKPAKTQNKNPDNSRLWHAA